MARIQNPKLAPRDLAQLAKALVTIQAHKKALRDKSIHRQGLRNAKVISIAQFAESDPQPIPPTPTPQLSDKESLSEPDRHHPVPPQGDELAGACE